jgi:hypothetical protein
MMFWRSIGTAVTANCVYPQMETRGIASRYAVPIHVMADYYLSEPVLI